LDTKTVSLIIPVYNVRDYLRKCLDSVAAQTYQALEVIIVNDGSTDDSLEIALEYTAKYSNFKCYTIENRGQGGARNYGLKQATGEYVMFLDSDDYLSKNCVETLIAAAQETEADIVCANCYDVQENGAVLAVSKNEYQNAVTSLQEEPALLFNRVAPWGKLYKRQLWNEMEFACRVWYEDMRLIPKLYLRAEKICYIEDAVVYYVQRSGSTMNNRDYRRNLEIIEAFNDLLGYYQEQGVYERYREELEFLVIEHIAVSAIGRVALGKSSENREVITRLQAYLATFEGLYDNPYLKTQTRNRKIILWCNRHGWYWATKLLLKAKQARKKEKKR